MKKEACAKFNTPIIPNIKVNPLDNMKRNIP